MKDFLTVDHIIEKNINMDGIPALLFRPKGKEGLLHTIIFYHGWGSKKDSQRLRAFILCSFGYQVIIPDAIHHGERSIIDYRNPNNARDYFWPVIFNNIRESDIIIKEAIEKYSADPKAIAVMGNSMGGFTSAGIFTHNSDVKTMVVFNGSCNWNHSNAIFKENFAFEYSDAYEELEHKINSLDPMNNLQLLLDRPILLLHGIADSVVPIVSQKIFYEKIRLLYKERNNINFIEYPNLNHFVTTSMMEETAKWFKEWL